MQSENTELKRRLDETTGERDELTKKLDALEAKLEEVSASLATANRPPPPPRRYSPDPAKTWSVALGKWPQRGPADAKVTMVVAREYACGFSEKARATIDELFKKYGKDLRVVFEQLIVHPRIAIPSALAACAANRQKKFDKLDLLLWEKGFKAQAFDVDVTAPDGSSQRCWTVPAGCPIVTGFAREAGLDIARFTADMPTCERELSDTAQELKALAVSSTPSFFINGRYLSGAQPVATFSQLVDEELAKANERIKKGTKQARYYQEWVIEKGEKAVAP